MQQTKAMIYVTSILKDKQKNLTEIILSVLEF